jgi:hypothetical protein
MMAHEEKNDRIAVDFIDPLFAVILSISLAQILDENWFKDFRFIGNNLFEVFTLFLLGYWTVILSWVGYHRSIQSAPIKVKEKAGFWRFIFDVILLIAYFVLLVSFHNFTRVLWTLFAAFAIYIPWDECKRREYPEQDYPERRAITLFWTLIFLLVASLYTALSCVIEPTCLRVVRWLFLVSAFLGVNLYRKHKSLIALPRRSMESN